ncbi:MAG TPA: ribosomal protein S18-alanine N-acetyltransferase [Thermoanaerobaculia bacterium]|nr:ribosomal protein S18-alanine N-acetyltransferase [Thermoanaerobaculia bacterium]
MSALMRRLDVREARRSDLDAIAELERLSFPVPWKREYFEAEIGAPFRLNLVARDERGRLSGYVFCAFAGGEIHVNKIAVAPEARRRGLATRLMDDVFSYGREIAAEEIYLEVRVSNDPARLFYEGLGFVEAGRRPRYYLDGEDALVMVCRLTRSLLDAVPREKRDSGPSNKTP